MMPGQWVAFRTGPIGKGRLDEKGQGVKNTAKRRILRQYCASGALDINDHNRLDKEESGSI
jgi:hypothetical protein